MAQVHRKAERVSDWAQVSTIWSHGLDGSMLCNGLDTAIFCSSKQHYIFYADYCSYGLTLDTTLLAVNFVGIWFEDLHGLLARALSSLRAQVVQRNDYKSFKNGDSRYQSCVSTGTASILVGSWQSPF